MTTVLHPIAINQILEGEKGRDGDRIPYLSRLLQRTTRQWSVCVVDTCIAQQACKGLCSKKVRVLEHESIVPKSFDNR